jgi:ATP-dependent RNA helicase RhlB
VHQKPETIAIMPSLIKKIGRLFSKKQKPGAKPAAPKKSAPAKKSAPTAAPERPVRKPHAEPRPKPQTEARREPRSSAPHADRPHRAETRPARRPSTPPPKKVSSTETPSAPWNPTSFPVEPEEGKTRFCDLALPPELLHAIADLNFRYCTPIQAGILPAVLKGQDMAGKAQTGTGKTAAFLLGIFTRFLRNPHPPQPGTPQALILAPTRELAMQIRDDAVKLGKYTPFCTLAIYGGIDYDKQRRMLEQPVDIIVATPGRLIDFANQGALNLRGVEVLVIDEADRMLDMGFIPDVRRIVQKTPPKENRQTLLFSATLDDKVMRLAAAWMVNPGKIEIEPDHAAASTVDQQVFIVTDDQKFALLYNLLTREVCDGSAIIFTNRRDQAERLSDALYRYGIDSEMLSGAVAQNKRQRILSEFKDGRCRLVVATDVAGRGIHVDDITHVINFNIPAQPDDYVHRIGRTGRAGKKGISVTFACEKESFELPAIEELLGKQLPCRQPEESMLELPAPVRKAPYRESRPPQRGGDRRSGSRDSGRAPRRSGPPRPRS